MVEMYDEHNKLKRYRFLNTGAYYQIEYDAVGRVWKRIDQSSNVSHFYHTGGKLAQELDGSYNVETDYLAGLRRYMPDEAEEDQYRYYARDHQGSVVQMTGHGTEPEEYTYDAWGEHADTDNLPSTANNIRYAGARLECFVDGANSKDAIYETHAAKPVNLKEGMIE
jgi:hypothetical protein